MVVSRKWHTSAAGRSVVAQKHHPAKMGVSWRRKWKKIFIVAVDGSLIKPQHFRFPFCRMEICSEGTAGMRGWYNIETRQAFVENARDGRPSSRSPLCSYSSSKSVMKHTLSYTLTKHHWGVDTTDLVYLWWCGRGLYEYSDGLLGICNLSILAASSWAPSKLDLLFDKFDLQNTFYATIITETEPWAGKEIWQM